MKKLICILALLTFLAALGGCDLRNRRPSSEFIPQTEPTAPTEAPATEPTETQPPATTEARELVVREIYAKRGSYTDRDRTTFEYSYRLPFLDYSGEFVARTNGQIDSQFRTVIDRQLKAMDEDEPLTVLRIDYQTRLRGDMLTIYLTQTDVDGKEFNAVFTVNRKTGKEITGEAILRYVGLTEEAFLELAETAVRDAFDEQYGDRRDDLRYTTALDKTLAEGNISTDMTMYLNQDDQLVIVATLYDLAGASYPLALTLSEGQP